MPEITFTDIAQLQAALARLTGPEIQLVAQRAGVKIGEHLKNKLERRPGPVSYPLNWSDEERKAYFAMRHAKGLPVKYTRGTDKMSQDLIHKWAVSRMTGGAVVGNPATYAPKVQSAQYQTPMHETTGWITDAQAVDETERENVIGAAVMAEVHSMVRRVLG